MKKIILYLATLIWALLIWNLTTTTKVIIAQETWIQTILMMSAHFFFFGVQAALLFLALSHRPLSIFHVPLIITSLYGLLIELVQRNVPGRSADPLDWALDTLGAVAFLYLFKKLNLRI